MRKTPSKLALRKETLRALSSMDLGRVVGGQGDDAAVEGSEAKHCAVAAFEVTDAKQCAVAALVRMA